MKELKIFFVVMITFASCSLTAQNAQIKKANKFYKLNQYNSAITLYEQGLVEDESLSAQTKLAYCYRMTNQMGKAEELYAHSCSIGSHPFLCIYNYFVSTALAPSSATETDAILR